MKHAVGLACAAALSGLVATGVSPGAAQTPIPPPDRLPLEVFRYQPGDPLLGRVLAKALGPLLDPSAPGGTFRAAFRRNSPQMRWHMPAGKCDMDG